MAQTLTFDWLKPSSLWEPDGLGFRQIGFFRPRLFEYRSDTFMDDFLADVAASDPGALEDALAVPEQSGKPLKLYQPLHGCFYLASGSLCCRQAGFPDRELLTEEGENVFFVQRRLVGGKEQAWVVETPDQKAHWESVNGQANGVLANEERRPLFTANTGSGRAIHFAYLPVASGETQAATLSPSDLVLDGKQVDLRISELEARFKPEIVDGMSDQTAALTISVYQLVELWDYLRAQPDLREVTDALLQNDMTPSFSGDKAQKKAALMTFLKGQNLDGSVTLVSALHAVAGNYAALNAPGGGDLAALGFDQDYNLDNRQDLSSSDVQDLRDKVQAALSDTPPSIVVPKIDPAQSGTQYVLRFVYERPQCDPPVHVVSQPSEPFTLAALFDPDAPRRQVRIPLPTDVSIAGLRKARKSVGFMLSDAMRKKMAQLTGHEKDLLEDPPTIGAEPTGDGFAFICTFSFEIIFIVAFFLLLVFVIILDFFFHWMFFFRICLPIPKSWLPEG
ncbi:MAG: hypothetical protein JW918_12625 [Anaerolineae bacterium]|nr:hypothetical protein [Anaerolineae bacterium]